jgi:uncharacterized membrane protein YuzA (DUF378 family)
MHAHSTRHWLVTIALVVLIIGGINWGLVGSVGIDLVAALFGAGTTAARIVYVLVGISALVVAVGSFMMAADRHNTTHSSAAPGSAPRPTANRGL